MTHIVEQKNQEPRAIKLLEQNQHYIRFRYLNDSTGTLKVKQMLTEKRLGRLIIETKWVGEYYLSAVIHPANYPELNNVACLNGKHGFLTACNIRNQEEFLFHESQMHRIVC